MTRTVQAAAGRRTPRTRAGPVSGSRRPSDWTPSSRAVKPGRNRCETSTGRRGAESGRAGNRPETPAVRRPGFRPAVRPPSVPRRRCRCRSRRASAEEPSGLRDQRMHGPDHESESRWSPARRGRLRRDGASRRRPAGRTALPPGTAPKTSSLPDRTGPPPRAPPSGPGKRRATAPPESAVRRPDRASRAGNRFARRSGATGVPTRARSAPTSFHRCPRCG